MAEKSAISSSTNDQCTAIQHSPCMQVMAPAKISRAQPHPQAAKVSQAEQRLEAVQEEQKDSAPIGRGVLDVLPPGEAKSKPRPKEVKHPDYTIVPPEADADAMNIAVYFRNRYARTRICSRYPSPRERRLWLARENASLPHS